MNIQVLIKNKSNLLLLILIIGGAFLRFYNLNWGAPFYFHPDERNIASSISQLNFPDNLNPKFFAYGSLPLYVTFFLGLIPSLFSNCNFSFPCSITFEQAIIGTRIIAAIFAVLLIPLTYFIAEKIKKGLGIPAALLTIFSTGYIQFAHFGTVEMWLTFFTLLLFLPLLKIVSKPSIRLSLFTGIILGILISTKVSSFPLFLLPAISLILSNCTTRTNKIIHILGYLSVIIIVAGSIFIVTNPFVFLDPTSFLNSIRYESEVALGTLPVFYTGEFFQSIPIIFQFTSIYPFLLNPLITLLFIAAFFHLVLLLRKDKILVLLFSFFLLTFLSQSFVFAKWTRYMLPTLPFVYLLLVFWIDQFHKKRKGIFAIIIFVSTIFSLSYFVTAFIEKDTRIQAQEFARQAIPSDAPVMSEVYDLGITPFNSSHFAITLFNTYDLDNGNPEYSINTLQETLAASSYIILPSQRVIKTRLTNPKRFPVGHRFYKDVYIEKEKYRKIYQTPCSLFCTIAYLGDPIFRYEQTAVVFDRPTVFIFQKL